MDEYFVALSEPQSGVLTWDSLNRVPYTVEGSDDTVFYAPVYVARWRARISRMLDMAYMLLASPRRKISKDQDTIRPGFPPSLDMVTAANDPGFTPEELADALDLPWFTVHDAVGMDKYPIRTDMYRLWARAVHEFSEAHHVVQFRALCERFSRTRIPEPA
ncbi:hypothetical protein IWQ61_010031 [Dispira simplex]|nr:hypothetical protein IWQ61_010031 [Dispira simplex]